MSPRIAPALCCSLALAMQTACLKKSKATSDSAEKSLPAESSPVTTERLLFTEWDGKTETLVIRTKAATVADQKFILEDVRVEFGVGTWEPPANDVNRLLSPAGREEFLRLYREVYKDSERDLMFAAMKTNEERLSRIERYQHRDGVTRALTLQHLKANKVLKEKKVSEIVDFVLEQYQERRGWSSDFQITLRNVASSYLNSSVYYVVRDASQPQLPIVATIRFIRAPFGLRKRNTRGGVELVYGRFGPFMKFAEHVLPNGSGHGGAKSAKFSESYAQDSAWRESFMQRGNSNYAIMLPWTLPMEKSLGLESPRTLLPRPCTPVPERDSPRAAEDVTWCGGEIVEPGNFAILKKHARIARPLLGLFASDFLKEHPNIPDAGSYDERIFYTYNDLPSLYTRMGFKIFGDPVKAYGTEWTSLRATPSDLMAFVEEAVAGRSGSLATDGAQEEADARATMNADACKWEANGVAAEAEKASAQKQAVVPCR